MPSLKLGQSEEVGTCETDSTCSLSTSELRKAHGRLDNRDLVFNLMILVIANKYWYFFVEAN